jgi:small-conductance mechanosensitive channel
MARSLTGGTVSAPDGLQLGSWLHATVGEAWACFTPFLVVAFLVALVIARRAARAGDTRLNLRGTAILLGLHVLSLPVLGLLASLGAGAYVDVRLVSITLATISGINIALALIFNGVLLYLHFETPRILSDVIAGAAYVAAAIVLLSTRGVNMSGLIATSAVLTAVIGFSLQDTLGNLMAGLALQMDKSIHPGEWITFREWSGRIVEMRWRQTSIETRDWETVVIPNSMLVKNEIVVLGRREMEPVQLRRNIRFNVDFRFKPPVVIDTCVAALGEAPMTGVAREPAPDCVLSKMEDSYNQYTVRYFLTDFGRLDVIDSLVRTRIFYALERAGIPLTIPAQAVFLTPDTDDRRARKAERRVSDRKTALHECDLFCHLGDDELAELAEAMHYAPFAPGEILTRQGDPGHELFLIAHGKVAVRVSVAGREHEVTTLEAGAFFGERSLMTGEPRSATAVALTEVLSYRLDKEALERVLKRRPEIAEELAEVLARRQQALASVRKGADGTGPQRALDQDKGKLLGKIRGFFGL